MSTPSASMSFVRLKEEDWRRMARISAEYCLFWETVDSLCWIRLRSQGMKGVSLPTDSEIADLEERFSRTPSVVNYVSVVGSKIPILSIWYKPALSDSFVSSRRVMLSNNRLKRSASSYMRISKSLRYSAKVAYHSIDDGVPLLLLRFHILVGKLIDDFDCIDGDIGILMRE